MLCAETERVHCAEPRQNVHTARGEALRRAQAVRHRQLQNDVRPALHRRRRAHSGGEHGDLAALDERAAHQAHDGGVCAETLAELRKLPQMSAVKGVILADHARRRHALHLISPKYRKSTCFPRINIVLYPLYEQFSINTQKSKRQHCTIWQADSPRDFSQRQDLKRAGILCVFRAVQSAALAEKIRRSAQTQLRSAA